MPPIDFYVCTTCFGLTSAGTGMQRCRCEEYKAYPGVDCPSGYHLCYMCAAVVAGGTGRYSWNACEVCLKFNRKLARDHEIALPLGRHSLMNGFGIPMRASNEVQEQATKDLLRSLEVAGAIEDWGLLQARALFESVLSWKNEPYVARRTWEAKFALGTVKATSRSVAAFKGYLRVESFGEKSYRE
jgi:hypothetical protein